VSPDAVSRVAAWIARRFAAHPLPAALVSLSMLGVYNLGVFGSVSLLGGQSVVFYDILDLPGIAGFAPFFALGVLLAKRPDLLASFVRASRTAVALALGAALAMALAPRQGLGAAGKAMTLVAFPIVGVLMTHALFSWTHRFLDRSNGVIRVLADSSFTMYLVHQPIIVALGFLFLGVAMSPIAGATIIVAVATGASIAAHRLIATRPALLFLFNGVRRRPAPETVA
jgi:glucan biosynthesis protein C